MKNRYRELYFLLTFLLVLAGCSMTPARPSLTKVSLPPHPIIKDSFSVLPLNEDGWVMLGQENDTLMLGTRGALPGETRAISGFVRPIPANMTDDGFFAYAKSVKKMDPPKRYELLRQEAQKDDSRGQECVKVRATMKDLAPVVPPGVVKKSDSMILDSLYWVCKHPDGQKAVIVEYSDRLYVGSEKKGFDKNAEAVFRGFEFIVR